MHAQVGHKPRVGVDIYIGVTHRYSTGTTVVHSDVGVIAIAMQVNRLPVSGSKI